MTRTSLAATLLVLPLLCLTTGCPIPGIDPPGEVIAGSGPITSAADARQRVLAEFFGVTDFSLEQLAAGVLGTGGHPAGEIYQVPGGALPNGTVITDPFGEYEAVTLNDTYYVFWVDPYPLVDLGHETYIAYVRMRDGRITRQTVQFAPIAGGTESLFHQSDRDANRIYRHELMDTIVSFTTAEVLLTAAKNAEQDAEPDFGGLFVAGTDEWYREASLDASNLMFQAVTGDEDAEIDSIKDDKDDRLDRDKLAKALRDASAGLGEGDKFFFILSTHGSQDGHVRIGKELVSWADLCKLIFDNVKAENICAILGPCYSGLAITTFAEWDDETSSGLTTWAATDSTNAALTLFPTICALKALIDNASAEGDPPTPVSPAAISETLQDLTVTKADLKKKVCEFLEAAAAAGDTDVAEAFDGFKEATETVGGSTSDSFEPSDPPAPADPVDLSGVFNPTLFPLIGTGETNDGGGLFDLTGGSLSSDDDGETIQFDGVMQITNQIGQGPGTFTLNGTRTGRTGNEVTYDATGLMQVFGGAQMEDLAGTLTLLLSDDEVRALFEGTHTEQQRATFDMRIDRRSP